MTEPSKETNPDNTDPEPADNSETPAAEPADVPADQSSETGKPDGDVKPPDDEAAGQATADAPASESSDEQGDEDELPEYEPLTPELVEEEAIRGDFMLRWFLVLLAVLLACTEIAETRTLVHISTGQYLMENGWLPPATDVFSYTAEDRSWTNLSWMFDLLTAALFNLGGAAALSIGKAIIAAFTFGLLVHISRAEVSTWWGTICAALAALACFPQFTWQPELITLLGLTVTLWSLHRWREQGSAAQLWLLVPVFVLWSNLDPRMYLGLDVLLFYALGEVIGNFLGRPGLKDGSQRTQLWIVIGCCAMAALLNPFGWQSLLSPLSLYGVEYPALRQFTPENWQNYPLASPTFWSNLNAFSIAGLLLMAATLGSLALNWSRLDFGEVCLFLGFAAMVVAGSHELAAASIVCCVLATLNGQSWYRESIRQTYSVAMGELLFSRGGRALTVLGMFAVAYLSTSGRLAGTSVRRTGLGFESNLAATVQGMRQDLEGSFDDRPFNLEPAQGDVLIFTGHKAFADSRVALYSAAEPNLLSLQQDVKHALGSRQPGQPDSGNEKVWRETLDEYDVTHVLPQLGQTVADSGLYFDLLKSSLWQLARLGSITAVFYRTDLESPEMTKYLEDHRVNFIEEAFRTPIKKEDIAYRVDWARPRSVYQKYLSLPSRNLSNPLRRALHYHLHLEAANPENRIIGLDLPMMAAICHLIIRNANDALSEDPNDAVAFLLLGNAYQVLEGVEAQFSRSTANAPQQERRYLEAVNSYHQAVVVEPRNYTAYHKLVELYLERNRFDLAQAALQEYLRLVSARVDLSEAERERKERLTPLRSVLAARIEDAKARVQGAQGNQADVLTLARLAYQSGCVDYALELLEAEPNFLALNPEAQLMQAQLLLEAGRAEEASLALGKLEGIADRYPQLRWRWPAALTYLANGRYGSAVAHLKEQKKSALERELTGILQSMPLVQPPQAWPQQQTDKVLGALYRWPIERAQVDLNIAMTFMESGEVDEAKETLETTVDENPDTPLRRLVLFYLSQLTGETYDVRPPSDWIPVSPDMFASDKEQN